MQEFLGKPLNLCTCFEAQTINVQFTDPRLLRRAFKCSNLLHRRSGFRIFSARSLEHRKRVLKAKQQSVVERIRDGMEFVRGGISLRNKGEETRFKLNIPLSSYKAIKGIQLATIDGLPLKGNSFIRWKRDISPGNGFRAISLIVEGEWMTASLHMSHTIQCNNLK